MEEEELIVGDAKQSAAHYRPPSSSSSVWMSRAVGRWGQTVVAGSQRAADRRLRQCAACDYHDHTNSGSVAGSRYCSFRWRLSSSSIRRHAFSAKRKYGTRTALKCPTILTTIFVNCYGKVCPFARIEIMFGMLKVYFAECAY